ncbi:glycosyl transferase family 1 [Phyllobacterium brassicacearum]|uniref:Glycosyl transferase family 1 n=1 Tax=Phyllobacterium brassicacearum TaxID=314235 RepID=A0A2P7BBA1_9HYPH|nr:glycosyltransferase family 4 protein [Phyllobacterium brassicacearum]PSH63753.1 glycosyl transferase family 1 [Phyllobacterium brassicacearum]TDQ31965.1 rhamnosyl/mannosyltransferase [Phyllobacterium brassicacearum]
MRVLHFFKTYWPDTFGGVERTIHSIAKGTSAYGVETQVLSLSREPKKNSLFFDGHWAHKAKLDFELASTGFSLSAFHRFSELANEADVIHYHFPWPFMDIVHFATRLNKPTVVTYHSDIVKQQTLLRLYRPLMRRFLKSVDQIVVTSPNYLDSSEQLSEFKSKSVVVPIGLDRDAYPPLDEARRAAWRAKLPERFFLFVGVLRYYKGLHILLEAARQTGHPIVIVGTGPVEGDLKLQAVNLNLRDVFFLGSLPDDDKVALLDLCYAAIFPSHLRSEAFGLSLVEAAMFGKAMITCEIGTGTSYVNLHNQTGLVVSPNNPVELANAMTTLWEEPDLNKQLGAAALWRYENNFKMAKMSESYADIYEAVASKNRPT